jgi:hypothetical protein
MKWGLGGVVWGVDLGVKQPLSEPGLDLEFDAQSPPVGDICWGVCVGANCVIHKHNFTGVHE